VTTGYGPECITIPLGAVARTYPYRLQAHYYSRGPMGYGMGKPQIIEHDGKGSHPSPNQRWRRRRATPLLENAVYCVVDDAGLVGDRGTAPTCSSTSTQTSITTSTSTGTGTSCAKVTACCASLTTGAGAAQYQGLCANLASAGEATCAQVLSGWQSAGVCP